MEIRVAEFHVLTEKRILEHEGFKETLMFTSWQKHTLQLTFTCSKSTTETLEKGARYVLS